MAETKPAATTRRRAAKRAPKPGSAGAQAGKRAPGSRRAELKTQPTDASVAEFLAGIGGEQRRKDCRTVLAMMKRITGSQPRMWGPSIVGFGRQTYGYESGREGEWFQTGFSPRKQSLTLYVMSGFDGYPSLLKKLGKHKTGKSCLYIDKLADVDLATLETLIRASVTSLSQPPGRGAG